MSGMRSRKWRKWSESARDVFCVERGRPQWKALLISGSGTAVEIELTPQCPKRRIGDEKPSPDISTFIADPTNDYGGDSCGDEDL